MADPIDDSTAAKPTDGGPAAPEVAPKGEAPVPAGPKAAAKKGKGAEAKKGKGAAATPSPSPTINRGPPKKEDDKKQGQDHMVALAQDLNKTIGEFDEMRNKVVLQGVKAGAGLAAKGAKAAASGVADAASFVGSGIKKGAGALGAAAASAAQAVSQKLSSSPARTANNPAEGSDPATAHDDEEMDDIAVTTTKHEVSEKDQDAFDAEAQRLGGMSDAFRDDDELEAEATDDSEEDEDEVVMGPVPNSATAADDKKKVEVAAAAVLPTPHGVDPFGNAVTAVDDDDDDDERSFGY